MEYFNTTTELLVEFIEDFSGYEFVVFDKSGKGHRVRHNYDKGIYQKKGLLFWSKISFLELKRLADHYSNTFDPIPSYNIYRNIMRDSKDQASMHLDNPTAVITYKTKRRVYDLCRIPDEDEHGYPYHLSSVASKGIDTYESTLIRWLMTQEELANTATLF